jgi:alginate O-acetyltransferase complex protein AlgI
MFWRRWHITLASWMRDYVYIPMGGSRVGPLRRALNVLVTFLLVGLWHGANWTFVVWGLLHGIYLVVESRLRAWRQHSTAGAAALSWLTVLCGVVVFALVTFAWLFFRAPSVATALDYLVRAVDVPLGAVDHLRYAPTLAVSAVLLAYEWLTRRWEFGLSVAWLPLPARWGAYLSLCMALLLFGYLGGRQGIYVQF